ncbi:unnamed protein product [Cylindrotheca closterium]|uniref:Mitochondrial import inner membrane translocase subunit TIM22 n=1 Tax=Cylindrotheca closterium TaxID=2856 RepID=A0AAD2JNM4_9STRA|nr:unnamed protein product [Cylindrotheca closterium]
MYYNSVQPSGYRDSTLLRSRRSSRYLSSGLHSTATLVGRRKKKVAIEESVSVPSTPEAPTVSFDDLSPVGKVIAGTTQIAVTTAMDFVSGFLSGYVLGTIVGVPMLLIKPLDSGVPRVFMTEVKGRLGRMNAKSMRWGTGWGGMSAAFGGFKTSVLVLRNGKHDSWNEVFSSAAAGAWFARKEGPQAMLKGAILYGGMIYVFSGAGRRGTLPPEEYTEAPVEF